MGTRQESTHSYHTCTCGATFDSTEALLDHAREAHGLDVY
jgi:hypothetical protein